MRTAGNYVDDAGFGSLAYGVAALKIPLIVVLGHEACGAVAAATDVVNSNSKLPVSLTRMVEPILPAVIDAKANLKAGENLVDAAILNNTRRVALELRDASDPIIGEPVKQGKVMVVPAVYSLKTGAVTFLEL
ncbi:MAG: carbonic anhydrase [Parasphingorhabdus sp.]|nr:carbonic anhydrase [Parasphingorhabdus sp.]